MQRHCVFENDIAVVVAKSENFLNLLRLRKKPEIQKRLKNRQLLSINQPKNKKGKKFFRAS